MLRKLVLALVLGNLLLWAWAHGVLRPFGWAPATVEEPQRLRQQWHPEALQLEAPGGAASGSAGASLAQRQSAASASGPAAGLAASPASGAASIASAPAGAGSAPRLADAGTCLRIGPFAEHADAALGDALRAAGLPAQPLMQDLPAQWMVLMGPYADTAALQRKLGELRRLALPAGEYAVVSARPRYMPGISLGVYARREAAEAALQRLQSHGVQTAHVVQRNLGLQQAWWVLTRLDAAQAQRLRELPALRSAHAQLLACPAGPTGDAGSAAATAAPASDAPGAPRSSPPAAGSRR